MGEIDKYQFLQYFNIPQNIAEAHTKGMADWVSDWSVPLTSMTQEAATFAVVGDEYQNSIDEEETSRAILE